MGNKIVLNNANIINDNIDETNINWVKILYKETSFSPSIFKMVNKAGKNFFRYLHIINPFKKSYLRILFSKFYYLGIVIEEIVLLILLFIYFIIGATAVILYRIFYEQVYEMILNKGGKKNINLPIITSVKTSILN
ncbi:MAG: hypothetical protein ABSF81_15895 [Bacteroidales bacterium]